MRFIIILPENFAAVDSLELVTRVFGDSASASWVEGKVHVEVATITHRTSGRVYSTPAEASAVVRHRLGAQAAKDGITDDLVLIYRVDSTDLNDPELLDEPEIPYWTLIRGKWYLDYGTDYYLADVMCNVSEKVEDLVRLNVNPLGSEGREEIEALLARFCLEDFVIEWKRFRLQLIPVVRDVLEEIEVLDSRGNRPMWARQLTDEGYDSDSSEEEEIEA